MKFSEFRRPMTPERRARIDAVKARLAEAPDHDDHDWSSTGSPSYCRGCHITFPAWQHARTEPAKETP